MSKIKMRTPERTIKGRDRRKTAEQAFRRKSIKALAKAAEPPKPEQETVEAQAMDNAENTAVSAAKNVRSKITQKRKNRGYRRHGTGRRAEAHFTGGTAESAVPSAALQPSGREHAHHNSRSFDTQPQRSAATNPSKVNASTQSMPETTPQPAPRIRTELGASASKLPVRPQSSAATRQQLTTHGANPSPKIRSAAVTPKQPPQAIRQRANTAAVGTPKATNTGKTVRARQMTQAAKAAQTAKSVRSKQKVSQRIAAAMKATTRQLTRAIRSLLIPVGGAAGVLAPLLVIVIIGGLLASPLGLFLSAEADGEMTLQQAMAQLNTAFSDRITEIENTVAHDDVRQSGRRAVWKEILTIYAVRTTTDTENAMDAVTMDDEHFAVLQEVFWDMNTIEYTTEIYTEEVTVEIEDSNGEMTEEVQTVEYTRLVVSVKPTCVVLIKS